MRSTHNPKSNSYSICRWYSVLYIFILSIKRRMGAFSYRNSTDTTVKKTTTHIMHAPDMICLMEQHILYTVYYFMFTRECK